MTAAVQICLTWFCIFIYAPVFVRAVQQIRSGEVILHGQGLQWRTARRYTGASVWAYGLGQALSAIIVISGTISAFLRDDFLFFVLTIVVSWLVGQSGLWLADQLGYEELVNPQAEAIDFLNRVISTIRVNVNRPEPGPGERQLNEADDGTEDAEYRFVKPPDGEDPPSEPD